MEDQEKQKKSFKDRYNEDPEFKQRHLAYVKEKQECSCGRMVSRSNMAKHKQTELHKKREKKQQDEKKERVGIDNDVIDLIVQRVIQDIENQKQHQKQKNKK